MDKEFFSNFITKLLYSYSFSILQSYMTTYSKRCFPHHDNIFFSCTKVILNKMRHNILIREVTTLFFLMILKKKKEFKNLGKEFCNDFITKLLYSPSCSTLQSYMTTYSLFFLYLIKCVILFLFLNQKYYLF